MKNIAVVFLACLALNCSKTAESSKPKPINEELYFPMEVGSNWDYVEDFSEGGEMVAQIIVGGKMTQTVRIMQKSDDKFLFEETSYFGNLAGITTQHIYELRNDMLMLAGFGGGVKNLPMKPFVRKAILLKFPLRMNPAWEYTDDKGETHHLRLERSHDTVSVLGRVYQNVIEVSDSVQNSKIEYKYYAYNVGLIKIEIKFIDPETIKREEELKRRFPTYEFSRSLGIQLKSCNLKGLSGKTS